MKNSWLFLLLSFATISISHAQMPRFQKQAVGDSECSVYFPGLAPEADTSFSPDGSKVYTQEISTTYWGDYTFSAIVVRLKDIDLKNQEEHVLTAYLDFLKNSFSITEAAGYGKGHRLESHPSAFGIIDYWQDGEGSTIAVKAWGAENTIGVLLITGPKIIEPFNIQEMFLNSFRFPGD